MVDVLALLSRVGRERQLGPFFLETLLNPDLTGPERPAVLAHEWAHLSGYAPESDASFVGLLAALRAGPAAEYSAWLDLVSEVGEPTAAGDAAPRAREARAGPRDDQAAIRERLKALVRPVERVAWSTYDRMLKSQGVEEGVQSYSRVIQLLLGTDALKIPAAPSPSPKPRPMKTRVIQVDRDRPDPAAIEEAAQALRDGKLVVFPDRDRLRPRRACARSERAVQKIFDAKERPANDPLIVHIAHIGQVNQCAAGMPAGARKLGLSFWAGPLTLILPKKPTFPIWSPPGLPSVALRVPSHRVARALMEMAGVPVAAPSANRFSRPSPTTAAHVIEDLDGRVDLILDAGPTDIGLESTIVDFTVDPPVLRRPGGITLEQVQSLVPEVVVADGRRAGPTSRRSRPAS